MLGGSCLEGYHRVSCLEGYHRVSYLEGYHRVSCLERNQREYHMDINCTCASNRPMFWYWLWLVCPWLNACHSLLLHALRRSCLGQYLLLLHALRFCVDVVYAWFVAARDAARQPAVQWPRPCVSVLHHCRGCGAAEEQVEIAGFAPSLRSSVSHFNVSVRSYSCDDSLWAVSARLSQFLVTSDCFLQSGSLSWQASRTQPIRDCGCVYRWAHRSDWPAVPGQLPGEPAQRLTCSSWTITRWACAATDLQFLYSYQVNQPWFLPAIPRHLVSEPGTLRLWSVCLCVHVFCMLWNSLKFVVNPVKRMGYRFQLVRLFVRLSRFTPLTLWTPLLPFRLVRLRLDLIHMKAKTLNLGLVRNEPLARRQGWRKIFFHP